MADITLKCSWCLRYYKAQRRSSKYCGGTCRQKAHRSRNNPSPSRPVSGSDHFDNWLREFRRAGQLFDELRQADRRINDLEIQLQDVRRRGREVAVTPDQWERLVNMDDQQLRQWVMAGRTMARRKHESPVDNAIRWVEDNRVDAGGE